MNTIWFLMMTLSLCFLVFSTPSTALSSMISAGGDALSLAIELCAVYAVWLGILELVEASGLSQKLAKFLHPVIKWLFKIDDPVTEKLIALNMSANMLGLGNAATPMGIAAMKRLDDKSGIATPAIIMLIVLNSTSIQLLPSTVIGLRAAAGSSAPADIIIPTLISTVCTCIVGVSLVKLFNHFRKKFSKSGQAPKNKNISTLENRPASNQQLKDINSGGQEK